jgi:uncharacterized protein
MARNRHFALWLTASLAVIYGIQLLFPSITDNFLLSQKYVLNQPWILLTSIFLHGSPAHLLFNAFGLAVFGMLLEEIIGTKRFLLVFFATGIVSGIASVLFYPSVLGASGAIFGVLGALTVLRPNMTVWVYYIPMPMYMAAIVWAIADLFGFFFPSGIANAGHIGGLVSGLIAGFLMRKRLPSVVPKAEITSDGDMKDVMTVEEFENWEKEYMSQNRNKAQSKRFLKPKS